MLETLRAELPDVRWLALSVSDAAEDVIAVIRAGARGYVTKTISGPDLLDAVRRVADGDVVFSPRLAGFVLDAFAAGGPAAAGRRGGDRPGLDLLSAREREVMQLLARGYTYREIGAPAVHLGEDGGVARLERAAQAAAVQPQRAHPLGGDQPPAVRSCLTGSGTWG